MSERSKELASKASVGETLPWVRIPPSPPISLSFSLRSPYCSENLDFPAELAGIHPIYVLSLRFQFANGPNYLRNSLQVIARCTLAKQKETLVRDDTFKVMSKRVNPQLRRYLSWVTFGVMTAARWG